jgi:MFS family permease
MATGLAPIVGGLGGGLVYESIGPRSMFLIAAAAAAAGGGLGVLAVPRASSRPRGQGLMERS